MSNRHEDCMVTLHPSNPPDHVCWAKYLSSVARTGLALFMYGGQNAISRLLYFSRFMIPDMYTLDTSAAVYIQYG